MPQHGNANISRVQVTLPKTELLENAHIRTICTRVQFAAGAGLGTQCPKGSVYGHVKATTPILGYTLSGPVYLRSSDNPLPDMVAVVRGPASQPIAVAAVGRIDAVHARIRTTFETFPDVPVSKVILTMQGKGKGLLANTSGVCAQRKPRARASFDAHSGKASDFNPVLKASCGGKAKRKGHKGHKR
jgi:hypothetical protein